MKKEKATIQKKYQLSLRENQTSDGLVFTPRGKKMNVITVRKDS